MGCNIAVIKHEENLLHDFDEKLRCRVNTSHIVRKNLIFDQNILFPLETFKTILVTPLDRSEDGKYFLTNMLDSGYYFITRTPEGSLVSLIEAIAPKKEKKKLIIKQSDRMQMLEDDFCLKSIFQNNQYWIYETKAEQTKKLQYNFIQNFLIYIRFLICDVILNGQSQTISLYIVFNILEMRYQKFLLSFE
ncbi:hypothetical protein pb186bvf_019199 [Paramecium bursaria]